MALKITGGILFIAASFLFGCQMAKKLTIRRNFIESFIAFLSALATNIRYSGDDISRLLSLTAAGSGFEYIDFNSDLENIPFEIVLENQISALSKRLSLKHCDEELLREFSAQLGKTDVEGQLKHIELYKEIFEKQLKSANDDINQKSRLYKTMGFFVGAAAVLMII